MRSMTGCGVGRVQRDGWEVTAELKTVNHRFLDISMRLPRNISFLEQPVRNEITQYLKRGHVDVYLTVRSAENAAAEISVDFPLAQQYYQAANEVAKATGALNDLTVSSLMKLEGVTTLTEKEMDQELVSAICSEAVRDALTHVISMREKEGGFLKADLETHLQEVSVLRNRIQERAPGVVSDYRERLDSRLKAMIPEGLDPQRMAQEVALMADRCAIDEELARLDSHIAQMRQYLNAGNEIGKKMDFLIQEMNRETNTIGSKAQDGAIAQWVVDLKSEIEKLREQIQNVE